MNVLKILSVALKFAAPIAAGVVAGPEAGALVAGAFGAGAATKVAGKAVERATGRKLHAVAAPVAAVAFPALVGPHIAPQAIDGLCRAIEAACGHPAAVAAIPGLLAWLVHVFARGVEDTAGR